MATTHTCSASITTQCPTCGHQNTRDAFEGYETRPGSRPIFYVRCPNCEAPHPDQTDHDKDGCDACYENERDELARRG